MNISNDIYINTLKSIVQFTNKDKCWLIGSGGLILLSQGYPSDNYKQFIHDTETFKQRDLDLVITPDYDIVRQLKKIGTLIELKSKFKTSFNLITLGGILTNLVISSNILNSLSVSSFICSSKCYNHPKIIIFHSILNLGMKYKMNYISFT